MTEGMIKVASKGEMVKTDPFTNFLMRVPMTGYFFVYVLAIFTEQAVSLVTTTMERASCDFSMGRLKYPKAKPWLINIGYKKNVVIYL